jgi:DNA-directed RNA polymerase subunit RPC12/RpoP
MPQTAEVDEEIICPHCRVVMARFAIAPHRIVRTMQRNIYVCSLCNRSQSYMVPAAANEDSSNGDAYPFQPPRQRGRA